MLLRPLAYAKGFFYQLYNSARHTLTEQEHSPFSCATFLIQAFLNHWPGTLVTLSNSKKQSVEDGEQRHESGAYLSFPLHPQLKRPM